jgi:hypothetical protein
MFFWLIGTIQKKYETQLCQNRCCLFLTFFSETTWLVEIAKIYRIKLTSLLEDLHDSLLYKLNYRQDDGGVTKKTTFLFCSLLHVS